MQKIFLISAFTLITLFTMAQKIGDVKRNDDGYTIVYDTANRQIASGYTGDRTYDWDYSSCIIVVRGKDSKWTMVYDDRLNQLSLGYTGEVGYSFKVVGCKIILKKSDGWKMIYDKELRLLQLGW